jgi:hypothetical protein
VTCEFVVPELIAFHFGSLGEQTREEVEVHLLGCPGCLRTFIALKHDIECPEDAAVPSQAARDRLRRAVVDELRASTLRPRRWWEAPLALAIGATAAVVAVLAVETVASGPGVPPRTHAERAPIHGR